MYWILTRCFHSVKVINYYIQTINSIFLRIGDIIYIERFFFLI